MGLSDRQSRGLFSLPLAARPSATPQAGRPEFLMLSSQALAQRREAADRDRPLGRAGLLSGRLADVWSSPAGDSQRLQSPEALQLSRL